MSKRLATLIISVIFTCICSFADNGKPSLIIPDDTISRGSTIQIPVILNGARSVCAFQFSVHLPYDISIVPDTDSTHALTPGNLFGDHDIVYNIQDGVLRIACLSMTNSVLLADSGVLCNITLDGLRIMRSESKPIRITDIELSYPDVRSKELDDTLFIINTIAPEPVSDQDSLFTFSMSPFTFDGAFHTSVTIESDIDISTIAFRLSVPESIAQSGLLHLIGHQFAPDCQIGISPIDNRTYNIIVSASKGGIISSGLNQLADISLDYVSGLIAPGIYVIKLDNIIIASVDGTLYESAPLSYKLYYFPTRVEETRVKTSPESDSYYIPDGRSLSGVQKGINLIRHADGTVTKTIIR